MNIQKQELTELDIYHRILRFKNYLVAMVNKGVIQCKFSVPCYGEKVFFTQGLKFNYELILFCKSLGFSRIWLCYFPSSLPPSFLFPPLPIFPSLPLFLPPPSPSSPRHLSDLCVDERAPVRKSASQTLFSTISAHGTLLQKQTWKDVLWKVHIKV